MRGVRSEEERGGKRRSEEEETRGDRREEEVREDRRREEKKRQDLEKFGVGLGPVWGHCGDRFGPLEIEKLGWVRTRLGSLRRSFWGLLGVTLEVHLEIVLGPFGGHFGGPFWEVLSGPLI